jgi:N6-L-threonylcarbamoyladenine synthase
MINATLQIKLPRPMMHDGSLNFSFSGLKTAVMREWKKANDQYPKAKIEQITNMFAYEIQEAITDVLVAKTIKAAQLHQAKSILLSGGVAANKRLREKFEVQSSKFKIVAPPPALCTDNAAAIAAYAFFRVEKTDWKNIHAEPNLSVEINS